MVEENIFFLKVRDVYRHDVVTCAPDDTVVSVAESMSRRNISSLVVCAGGEPVGIVTDRDLRNKVVARGENPQALSAQNIMNAPLVTVGEDDFLFEALYRMSRHGIHRVVVVDGRGHLAGIVTDSDILTLQTRSPQQMLREIEEAENLETLRALHGGVQKLVVHLVATGVATRDLVRMIALLNDRILLRVIALLRAEKYADLTERFAFIVLGSEGRREQTLSTDQDNAIVYADDLSPQEIERIEAFSRDLIDALLAIGVPPCPGGIMARNEFWRRSLGEWMEAVDDWLATPSPENILNGSMLFDLRTLFGDGSFERALKTHIKKHLAEDAIFLARTAENILRFQPPLGWFGRIKVEKKGEHRGQLEIKKAGIFALTEGAKVLALEAGVVDGGTRERLRSLQESGVLESAQLDDLLDCYDYLIALRLRFQVAAIRQGQKPSNSFALEHLNRMEKARLRLALEEVGEFQALLKRHFRLELIQ